MVCIVVAAGYWSYVSFLSAGIADVASDDLSHAWQTVWNVGHGAGFQHSHLPLHHNATRLATHADYLLALLAPLSWIWPNYQVILLFQAVAVALGAWLVWKIAWRLLHDDLLSFIFALSYLLAGAVVFPVLWEFHAVTLALPLILGLGEAILAGRRGWIIWLWFVLALTTKEQVGFIIGPLALWLMWRGRRRLGWWLFGAGMFWSLVHYLVILPHFAPTEVDHVFWQFYFGSLGHTPGEILPKLMQPMEILHRLNRAAVGSGVAGLLMPLAFLPLLHPFSLLAVVAILPHWLADPISVNGIFAQNHILALPILLLAAVLAVQKFQRGRHWVTIRWVVVAGLAFFALIGTTTMSPYPWSMLYAKTDVAHDPDLRTLQQLNRNIPTTATVGYTWGIPPIFANRETVHILPYGLETVDYAVVHTTKSPALQNLTGTYTEQLFTYFDHSQAFTTIFRNQSIGMYRRITAKTPEKLPDNFVDITPSWTGPCDAACIQSRPGE